MNEKKNKWRKSQPNRTTRAGIPRRECFYCKRNFIDDNLMPTLDHIIPLSDGGKDCAANRVPACGFCNTNKGSHELIVWLKNIQVPKLRQHLKPIIESSIRTLIKEIEVEKETLKGGPKVTNSLRNIWKWSKYYDGELDKSGAPIIRIKSVEDQLNSPEEFFHEDDNSQ